MDPSADLSWPARSADLSHGFCFTMVRDIHPYEMLGGEELQRVEWHRVVGPGDGEAGVRSRYFIGIARVGDWSVIVEDNGTLGVTGSIVAPLSAEGGEVVAYRGGGGGPGRLLVFRDGNLALDLDTSAPEDAGGSDAGGFRSELVASGLIGGTNVSEPTGPALRFLAARTGVPLTLELLAERTYLLVTVPQA
ncbi:hypothetical protein GCM10009828_005930 [Actinoplanes couchii]|uniref:Htaa domain-containing protein n=2 Tax=Actinoplanes couchii TaxID=403638 RepID=A0ABQ3XK09_9ACTN|nr:hypothetical protein Aco03nite_072300 [Actinoplanes couchii]